MGKLLDQVLEINNNIIELEQEKIENEIKLIDAKILDNAKSGRVSLTVYIESKDTATTHRNYNFYITPNSILISKYNEIISNHYKEEGFDVESNGFCNFINISWESAIKRNL